MPNVCRIVRLQRTLTIIWRCHPWVKETQRNIARWGVPSEPA